MSAMAIPAALAALTATTEAAGPALAATTQAAGPTLAATTQAAGPGIQGLTGPAAEAAGISDVLAHSGQATGQVAGGAPGSVLNIYMAGPPQSTMNPTQPDMVTSQKIMGPTQPTPRPMYGPTQVPQPGPVKSPMKSVNTQQYGPLGPAATTKPLAAPAPVDTTGVRNAVAEQMASGNVPAWQEQLTSGMNAMQARGDKSIQDMFSGFTQQQNELQKKITALQKSGPGVNPQAGSQGQTGIMGQAGTGFDWGKVGQQFMGSMAQNLPMMMMMAMMSGGKKGGNSGMAMLPLMMMMQQGGLGRAATPAPTPAPAPRPRPTR